MSLSDMFIQLVFNLLVLAAIPFIGTFVAFIVFGLPCAIGTKLIALIPKKRGFKDVQ